ncbi:MAG: PAS domain-containing protein [Pseudomonadota bacterium]|nr:PAS domain-containing protein [Pseudomonadota bacterium]
MTRYTDNHTSVSAKDFVIRRRPPTLLQLLLLFLSVLMVSLPAVLTISSKTALCAILFGILGAAGWYVILHIQRHRDLLLATEFQNALFASALGVHSKFCLIIRRDGSIVYMDQSFQALFPGFLKESRRTVPDLLKHARVSAEDSDRVFAAIGRGVYDKVIFDIEDSVQLPHRVVISIEPILRPSGFILLRGREFVERAGEASAEKPLLPRSTITLFSYVMDMMQVGVYMTDPAGGIIYANPLLEQWLGFREGEIASHNLSVKDIVNRLPDEYEGEALLQKKGGGQLKAFVNQKIIRDEQQKVLGHTALVHQIAQTPKG